MMHSDSVYIMQTWQVIKKTTREIVEKALITESQSAESGNTTWVSFLAKSWPEVGRVES